MNTKYLYVFCGVGLIVFCAYYIKKDTMLNANLPALNESYNNDSSNRTDSDAGHVLSPPITTKIPNAKITPNSSWEDVDLNDYPERFKQQIENEKMTEK